MKVIKFLVNQKMRFKKKLIISLALTIIVLVCILFASPLQAKDTSGGYGYKEPKGTVVYRTIFARPWESIEQFEQWYYDQPLLQTFIMPSGAFVVDCDDYAVRLQREALRQGYSVSCQLVENGKLFEVRVTDILEPHMGNLVIIGNSIYYVEPLPRELEIVRVCDKD